MKSQNNCFEFEQFSRNDLLRYFSPREGETKLGERITVGDLRDEKFVILGISEDVGPRANLGNGGSRNAFDAFLTKFLNMQSNKTLLGDECFIAGQIKSLVDTDEISALRSMVSELDSFVNEVLNTFDLNNKTLIVIGGGHNNAYPIIRHFSQNYTQSLNVLNIDPHADCRPLEGRHSGNPFSTALLEKQLASYAVLGLHQRYNSEGILQFLDDHNCTYRFFEDYLDGNHTLSGDLAEFKAAYANKSIGIEIDLDCIQLMPTSAFTPSGFSVNEIRSVVRNLPKQISYIHLPEGAPTNASEVNIVGKSLAYLVSDFCSCQIK